MPSLIDTAEQYLREEADDVSVAPRAEEEDGFLTLSGDWPVKLDEDYDAFVKFFGYNPEHWEVADPGKMSKWQQSKRTEGGDRDVVWLYSYRGVKFRRKTEADLVSEQQLQSAIARTTSWSAGPRRTLGLGLGDPVTYVHLQGDEQAGKYEGGGIEGLALREEAALEKSLNYVSQLMARGVNVEAIADVATGDRIENIYGHYNNQVRTAATMREQNAYAVQADVTRLQAFAELGLPIIAPRTPSNHGEHRPAVGVAPMTSESDNLDLQIAETVRFVLDQGPVGQQVQWHIPHDEFITPFELSGVKSAVTHGHKIRGAGAKAIETWVMGQRDRMAFHDDYKLRLLFMGHFHHFFAEELSGTTVIMAPSLDGGSGWFTQSSGQIATPGVLGLTVGSGHIQGWGNLTAL